MYVNDASVRLKRLNPKSGVDQFVALPPDVRKVYEPSDEPLKS